MASRADRLPRDWAAERESVGDPSATTTLRRKNLGRLRAVRAGVVTSIVAVLFLYPALVDLTGTTLHGAFYAICVPMIVAALALGIRMNQRIRGIAEAGWTVDGLFVWTFEGAHYVVAGDMESVRVRNDTVRIQLGRAPAWLPRTLTIVTTSQEQANALSLRLRHLLREA